MKNRFTLAAVIIFGIITFVGFQNFTSSSDASNISVSSCNEFVKQQPLETTAASESGAIAQEPCWSSSALFRDPENGSAANPRFQVITQSWPSSESATGYGYNPQTIGFGQPSISYSTFASTPGTSVAGVQKFALMWGNRCSPTATTRSGEECTGWDPKSTRYSLKNSNGRSTSYDFFFSTVAKADACTTAQTLATIGYDPDSILEALSKADVGLVLDGDSPDLLSSAATLATAAQRQSFFGSTWYPKYSDPQSLNSGSWVTDVCYLPELPPGGSKFPQGGAYGGVSNYVGGILFDWEVSDNRSAKQTLNFFEGITKAIHKVKGSSFKIIMSNDDVRGAGSAGGLNTESGPGLLKILDAVSIFVSQGPACNYLNTNVWDQMNDQMTIWNGGKIAPASLYPKFLLAYGLENPKDNAAELRQILLHNGFVYIGLQNPYIRQVTCDVSDASTQQGTYVVRHIKDLFNLPVPETLPPTAEIQASPSTALIGSKTVSKLYWFAQNPTGPNGEAQISSCSVSGPGLTTSNDTWGGVVLPPMTASLAPSGVAQYTMTCPTPNGPTLTATTSLNALVDFTSGWSTRAASINTKGSDWEFIDTTATSGHEASYIVDLPEGFSTSDTWTFSITASPIAAHPHSKLRIYLADYKNLKEGYGYADCTFSGDVGVVTKMGSAASKISSTFAAAKTRGAYTCAFTVQPNTVPGSRLRILMEMYDTKITYQGDGISGIQIENMSLLRN